MLRTKVILYKSRVELYFYEKKNDILAGFELADRSKKSEVAHCKFAGFPFTFVFCHFDMNCFFFREITIFISRLLLNDFFSGSMLKKAPIYYATVCESVFRIISRILDRKFESVETSSGFAQLLGENWGFQVISEKNY